MLKVLRHSDHKIDDILLAVLTSSLSTRDLEIAQAMGVSHFLKKPLNGKSLLKLVTSFSGFVIQDPKSTTGVFNL